MHGLFFFNCQNFHNDSYLDVVYYYSIDSSDKWPRAAFATECYRGTDDM